MYNRGMILGIILAAGRSSRMGRSKAMLPCGAGGEPFVRVLARALSAGGAAGVIVVGRPGARELHAEVEALGMEATFVENAGADAGQLSSLLAGLAVADRPGVRAILMTPVDAPLVGAGTVERLIAGFRSTGAPIVRAVHHGAHGHPVLFSRAVFDELRRADPSVGAKAVLRAYERAVLNVETDDPGVMADIDTPEDYRAVFGQPL